jgi:regulator of protease activity HflC (stomatin/prohibitin superfamily)
MPTLLILAIIAACLAVVTLLVRRGYVRSINKQETAAETTRTQREADREAASTTGSGSRGYDSDYGRSSYHEPQTTLDLSREKTVVFWLKWASVGLLVLAVLFTGISSATIVSTKNVGVVTSFGRPTGSLDNGFHMVLPWEKVTELDGAIQTDSHTGNGKDDSTPCTTVRIAHQSTACVDNSIRWRIRQGSADSLFRDYKDFANIRDSLVTRELGAALNTVFKDFDPLATDEKGNAISPSQDVLSASVTKLLQAQIGTDVEVLNVIVPIVHFDDNIQGRINALQTEVANTRIAQQRQLTADADAIANGKLAGSVSKDPNVLVSKCFDTLAQMVKDKQPIPAGFSCWPGSQSAVVVPATK